MRRLASVLRLQLAGCILCAASAHAQEAKPRTSSLSWVRTPGAEGCISTPALARSVEERLRRPVFVSAAAADVSVEGLVQPSEGSGGWSVTLTLRDASGAQLGTRDLQRDGEDCRALDASLSLVIAVMIDPDARPEQAPAETEPAASAPPAEARTVIQEKVVLVQALEKPRPTPWRFDGGAAGAIAVGPLPGAALGVEAHGLLEPPGWPSLEGFGVLYPRSVQDAPGPGSATFALGVLGGGVCPLRHHGERLHAYACVQGQIGAITARSEGVLVGLAEESRLFLASSVAARATVRVLGPLALRAGLGVAVPWLRQRFVYEDAAGTERELHRIAPVALQADLGVGVVFP